MDIGTTFELVVHEKHLDCGTHEYMVWYDAKCTVISEASSPSVRIDVECDMPEFARAPHHNSDSTIVLNGDGTGSDLEVGPGGHNPDEKPTPFKWTLDGSTLVLRFANREEQLVVTSIDHIGVSFGTGYVGRRDGWGRKDETTADLGE